MKRRQSAWKSNGVDPESFPELLKTAGQAEMEGSDDRIIAWHWADLSGSLIVRLPDGKELPKPLLIEERFRVSSANTGIGVSVPHLHIETGSSSKMAVLWSFDGTPDPEGIMSVVNAGLSAVGGDNSVLGHHSQAESREKGRILP